MSRIKLDGCYSECYRFVFVCYEILHVFNAALHNNPRSSNDLFFLNLIGRKTPWKSAVLKTTVGWGGGIMLM